MGVKLREKVLSTGEVSYYLDIYHNRKRWYEFLNIHVNKKKPSAADKDKKRLANEARIARENELIVLDNGLIDKKKKLGDFIEWYEGYVNEQNRHRQYTSLLNNLKEFQGGHRVEIPKEERKGRRKIKYEGFKSLPFVHINEELIRNFTSYLLKKVSNNTAWAYLGVFQAGLTEAERVGIIQKSPFRILDKKDKLKKKDIFRAALTLEQLQMLADTPVSRLNPQYKQLFFFSCFSGLRWSDVNCLRWSEIITKQLDGEEVWFIYFEQEKTEGIEYIPLSEQAIEILKSRKEERAATGEKGIYVFPECKEIEGTKRIYDRVLYALRKWGKAAIEKWGEECGITEEIMRPHTGRHTFATNVLENCEDGDLYTVQKLLGQKTWQAAQIYSHVRDRKKAAAVKSLPKINLTMAHSNQAA